MCVLCPSVCISVSLVLFPSPVLYLYLSVTLNVCYTIQYVLCTHIASLEKRGPTTSTDTNTTAAALALHHGATRSLLPCLTPP